MKMQQWHTCTPCMHHTMHMHNKTLEEEEKKPPWWYTKKENIKTKAHDHSDAQF